jgi:uncharacterized protein
MVDGMKGIEQACLLPLLLLICASCSDRGASHSDERSAGQPLAAHRLARPSGPVLDAANLLPPAEEAALNDRLVRLYQQTGHALVVVTTPSLGGEDVALYTRELANRWGVGDAEREDGVVLLVAPGERKVRIEVASGIRGRLPDALCARIVRERILPQFRSGAMVSGIEQGVDALAAAMPVTR